MYFLMTNSFQAKDAIVHCIQICQSASNACGIPTSQQAIHAWIVAMVTVHFTSQHSLLGYHSWSSVLILDGIFQGMLAAWH